jgi:hypothetical protein
MGIMSEEFSAAHNLFIGCDDFWFYLWIATITSPLFGLRSGWRDE